MAGLCAGCGIDTSNGQFDLSGPRSREWPYLPATLAANNGLRCDPETGELWVPPDTRLVTATDVDVDRYIVPDAADETALCTLDVSATAPARSNAALRWDVSGGYAGYRVGDANWWTVKRYVTVYHDGTPVGTSGTEVVSSFENNGGGVMGTAGPVDALHGWDVVPAGTVVRVLAVYTLDVLAYSANGANGFSWRSPRASVWLASVPAQ
jgi:hypothetical protein